MELTIRDARPRDARALAALIAKVDFWRNVNKQEALRNDIVVIRDRLDPVGNAYVTG